MFPPCEAASAPEFRKFSSFIIRDAAFHFNALLREVQRDFSSRSLNEIERRRNTPQSPDERARLGQHRRRLRRSLPRAPGSADPVARTGTRLRPAERNTPDLDWQAVEPPPVPHCYAPRGRRRLIGIQLTGGRRLIRFDPRLSYWTPVVCPAGLTRHHCRLPFPATT